MMAKGVALVDARERVLRQMYNLGDALGGENPRESRAERLATWSGRHEELRDLHLGR